MAKKITLFIIKWFAVFFCVSVIAFIIPRTIPKNPVEELLESHQMDTSPENIALIEKAWGLDKPLPVQYFIWVTNFIRGDWGNSLISKQDIKVTFLEKIPYSLAIGLGGLIISAVLAFFLGFGAAMRNKGTCDIITRVLSLISTSIPSFIVVVLIVYFVGVKWGLVKFFTGDGFWSMFFAILTMTLYSTGSLARVVKAHFQEQMSEPYVTFAVSRGFSKKYVLLHHAYKPVLYGLISVVVSRFAYILGGSTILEFAFGIPGISYFLVKSMQATDYYVLQSYIMVVLIWMFLVHLVCNLILSGLEVRGKT